MPNWKKIILSGSSANLSNLFVDNAVTASYFKGDGSGLTNVTTTVVENATVSDTFTNVSTKEVTHNFGTKDVIVSVYNSSDQLIIPSSITTTNTNKVDIAFDSSTSGRVVVAKGGHLASGSAVLTGTGVFSGSAQIVAATRYEETLTGNSSYTINHNLDEDYPIVQIYDTSKLQVIPGFISASSANQVLLNFDSSFEGKVIVKK